MYKDDTDTISTILAANYFRTYNASTATYVNSCGAKVGDIIRIFAPGVVGSVDAIVLTSTASAITVEPMGEVFVYDDVEAPLAVAAHATSIVIPDNAILKECFYDVGVTCTDGADDSATIALHIQGANDLVAAIAISDGTNVWDAGVRGTLIGAPILGADAAHDTAIEVAALQAASMLKMTAARTLTVTVADDDITAGKFRIYAKWVPGL